jgi:hypothetical protein
VRGADRSFRVVLPGARARASDCDPETSTMRWPRPGMGCCATGKKERNERACLLSSLGDFDEARLRKFY